ncbi:hypothetical protein [Paenibacillus sp. Soil522]|uniref:hypothetical protein n=1 Tax=Paenibacillus sp. Soil522 TaxID=1736388 RepID=UPI0006F5DBE7|nr:hypothetical protein [Paenibacillus sp. Soil522]KRE29810.1 hypothetical protein ASG81_26330 [Paenibacillus sp. Soil522]
MSFHYNSIQWCERLSGVQLYSVRNVLEKNVPQTLAALSAAGFREVELAGYYQIPPGQMKALLEQTQVRAVSTHVQLELLYTDLHGQLAYARPVLPSKFGHTGFNFFTIIMKQNGS